MSLTHSWGLRTQVPPLIFPTLTVCFKRIFHLWKGRISLCVVAVIGCMAQERFYFTPQTGRHVGNWYPSWIAAIVKTQLAFLFQDACLFLGFRKDFGKMVKKTQQWKWVFMFLFALFHNLIQNEVQSVSLNTEQRQDFWYGQETYSGLTSRHIEICTKFPEPNA